MNKKLKHASLFSGIGGFDLAAKWMGWENKFYCEIDPFCRKILNYHFNDLKSYENIKETDFREWRGKIDVLSGGFPCQPFSTAGKRKGTEDERYLWPEMLRAIREIKPKWVVGENVRGLLSWNEGMVLETVNTDLENEGYETEYFLLPACGVNAPHQRYRIFIIAHRTETRSNDVHDSRKNAIYTDKHNTSHLRETTWENFPTQSPLCGRDDGLSTELDGIAVSKWRTESVKAYGNSVVPQLIYKLFNTIEYVENLENND